MLLLFLFLWAFRNILPGLDLCFKCAELRLTDQNSPGNEGDGIGEIGE